MKIRSPSLVELHAFLAVCRHTSFRRAADELCVTPAAVSRAVLRLEEHLAGVRLFERSATGVKLTAGGLQLRNLTERHVLALESAAETIGRLAQPRRVRLSIIPTLSIQWLMPRLPLFKEVHQDIDIELRQFKHDEDFTRDDVDLWVEVKRPRRRWPDHIRTHYLLGREFIPVCAPHLGKKYREPADLQVATLLHHTNFPDNWERWFAKAGAPCQPRLGPGFDLTMHLIIAAKAGMGIAVVPGCLVERELSTGELVMPFDIPVSCGRGYFICWKRNSPPFSAQETFAAWLAEQAGTPVGPDRHETRPAGEP
ncbi:LysR substrate-binding domain-containing protein [Paracidovorax citrulli]|uniref:LysR substrate-binding domain-containing protein n=1 Tax=Paracidovorax citrulli TaxID=80869 RepID=UPI00061A51E0|nr:LysR substrate-binding domain-containing protein [Paracidovorax citrulli]QCX09653.1 Glycine cleavage system transcriptional activator [Paracidovorax citrulli]UEG47359.1 LysR family transcriptional regulator [Paracidovorax citrulli]UMT89366.1 LysR family transcriptional regulator [Paracidovorax citrulli]UMT95904.1 LysR family transcriptional regulator [Paracidovorax citrulli]WIY35877.1 LysR substrate-binding domain-containing protein [Paracidovorax citrulli]